MKYWIITNAVILGYYLYFSIPTWLTPAEQDIAWSVRDDHASDVLFLVFIPLLVTWLAINLIWLIVILINMRRWKLCRSLLIWLLVEISWITIFKYDRYRATLESPRIKEIKKYDPDYGNGAVLK